MASLVIYFVGVADTSVRALCGGHVLWKSQKSGGERERGIGILGILIGENLSIAQFMRTARGEYPNGLREGRRMGPLRRIVIDRSTTVLRIF